MVDLRCKRNVTRVVAALAIVATAAAVAPGADPASAGRAAPRVLGDRVSMLGVDGESACAATPRGRIWCWGRNQAGQLGNNSFADSLLAMRVVTNGTSLAGKSIKQIDVGQRSACAVTTEGMAACWGYNRSGLLGDGTGSDRLVPSAVSMTGPLAGKKIASISIGSLHACALTTAGTVGCWGDGTGALGNAAITQVISPTAPTFSGTGLAGKTFKSVVASGDSTCALATDSTIGCWGDNFWGQLGRGTLSAVEAPGILPTAGTPLAGKTIVQLTGYRHTWCATTTTGQLVCWGFGGHAELETEKSYPTPVTISQTGVLAGKSIAELGGGAMPCLRTTDQAVACWNLPDHDGVTSEGVMETSPALVPTPGSLLDGASLRRIDGGDDFGCALDVRGRVGCWGTNTFGQLGDGTRSTATTPAPQVTGSLGGQTVSRVAAGGLHACALASNGVSCWGGNDQAQLGHGAGPDANVPVPVTTVGTPLAGHTVVQLASSYDSVCATTEDHQLVCWGGSQYGDTPEAVTTAGTPLAGKTISQIVAGFTSWCALTTDHAIACWGSNDEGQVGDGTTATRTVPTAVKVTGTALAGKTVTSITATNDTMCALATDSTIACWGSGDHGALGRNDTTGADSATAVPVTTAGTPLAGKTLSRIGGGTAGSFCAVATDRTMACWGLNHVGQLGNGSDTDASKPTATTIAGTPLAGKTVAEIDGGDFFLCARASDSTLACWGDSTLGQVGADTLSPAIKVPTAVSVAASPLGAKSITQISGGNRFACALSADSIVSCWGSNSNGQLGNGTWNDRTSVEAVAGLPVEQPYSPYGSWDAMVQRVSFDLTNGYPTGASQASWVAKLSAGTVTPGDYVVALRGSTDNTSKVDPTVRLYRALLGRAPDKSGLRFWVTRRRTGTWTLVKMANYFATSSEFLRKYGSLTNRQFVTRIYTDVLGRAADKSGVDYWTRQLDLGRRSRGSVMTGFSESNEYKGKQLQNTDVAVNYIFLLGRAPTAAETTDWVTREKAGTTQADLADELLASQAYADHVGY